MRILTRTFGDRTVARGYGLAVIDLDESRLGNFLMAARQFRDGIIRNEIIRAHEPALAEMVFRWPGAPVNFYDVEDGRLESALSSVNRKLLVAVGFCELSEGFDLSSMQPQEVEDVYISFGDTLSFSFIATIIDGSHEDADDEIKTQPVMFQFIPQLRE